MEAMPTLPDADDIQDGQRAARLRARLRRADICTAAALSLLGAYHAVLFSFRAAFGASLASTGIALMSCVLSLLAARRCALGREAVWETLFRPSAARRTPQPRPRPPFRRF